MGYEGGVSIDGGGVADVQVDGVARQPDILLLPSSLCSPSVSSASFATSARSPNETIKQPSKPVALAEPTMHRDPRLCTVAAHKNTRLRTRLRLPGTQVANETPPHPRCALERQRT